MKATNEEIKEAYDFYKDYKHHYKWSQDTIQDAIAKFYQYYDGSTKVTSFAKLCIDGVVNSQLRKKYSHKHNGKPISINDIEEEDGFEFGRLNWLMALISDGTPDYFKDEDRKLMIETYLKYATRKQREVLQLYYFEYLTPQEIADLNGCTRSNISNLLEEAKKRIREKIMENKNKFQ